MITFLCVFSPIFSEKIGVFLKNQCYYQILTKTTRSLSKKRQYFRQFFGENIFKIITSAPGHTASFPAEEPG
jgi:hypothetical protein